MIKATELRIGNYAQDAVSKALLSVTDISADHWVNFLVVDRAKYPLQEGWQAECIPLTEEWLTNFGFEGDGMKQLNAEGVTFQYNLLDNFMFVNNHLIIIQYVHQLQNLYFALTGSELTIEQ